MLPGMPDGTTTIAIFESDRDRLESLRRYPGEPHRAVVRRLLAENEPLSPGTLAGIQASPEEVRRGEFVAHETLKRDLEME